MVNIGQEPKIRVGLLEGVGNTSFTLAGSFVDAQGRSVAPGDFVVHAENGIANIGGLASLPEISLSPADVNSGRFVVHGVKIGIDFHWERHESQQFQGTLILAADGNTLTVINELPLEAYLVSVISSEMSASCPAELLKAHAVVSRSWLLAQLAMERRDATKLSSKGESTRDELIRWYNRESHHRFDVCADDHCQRYQGIGKAFSQTAFDAIRDTRGKALIYNGEVCDARYSKSCGGVTEVYRAAWENADVAYLHSVYDMSGSPPSEYRMPLSMEGNAEAWITSSPPAYCGNVTLELLTRIATSFDQETTNFYRWRVDYSQEELREILQARYGFDFGRIRELKPLERGESGRIIRLEIIAEKRSLVIGKELEIRRGLSRSHLYSSAIVIRNGEDNEAEYPARFVLIGAGWGHGVGLCQIGAAVMAESGRSHEEILAHYFRGSELAGVY